MNNLSEEVFYGPYFLPAVSFILIASGVYSLITKKVLTPPRNIDPKWMTGRWAIVWGFLLVMLGIAFIATYFQRGEIYNH